MESYTDNTKTDNEKFYKDEFLKSAALALHYERQKIINANDSQKYYYYAALEQYYKSLAIYYKGFFSALEL